MKWVVLAFTFPARSGSTPRVGVWRRLKRFGAISPCHGLYVLPAEDDCIEAGQWLSQEVERAGGEAVVMHVERFEGVTDDELIDRFRSAADERYEPIRKRVLAISALAESPTTETPTSDLAADLARARAEFEEARRVDYFEAPAGEALAALIERVRSDLASDRPAEPIPSRSREDYLGRTWVTRPRPFVDRLACAWLILRFIDPNARIRYSDRAAASRMVTFDIPDGEFGHVGNRCTFEVMLEAFGLRDAAMDTLAGIVHEIDLKDGRYARPEVAGIEAVLSGWRDSDRSDAEIQTAGLELFDALYAFGRSLALPAVAQDRSAGER